MSTLIHGCVRTFKVCPLTKMWFTSFLHRFFYVWESCEKKNELWCVYELCSLWTGISKNRGEGWGLWYVHGKGARYKGFNEIFSPSLKFLLDERGEALRIAYVSSPALCKLGIQLETAFPLLDVINSKLYPTKYPVISPYEPSRNKLTHGLLTYC